MCDNEECAVAAAYAVSRHLSAPFPNVAVWGHLRCDINTVRGGDCGILRVVRNEGDVLTRSAKRREVVDGRLVAGSEEFYFPFRFLRPTCPAVRAQHLLAIKKQNGTNS